MGQVRSAIILPSLCVRDLLQKVERIANLHRSYIGATTEEERKANEAKNLLPPKQQPVHNFIVYLRTNELQ